MCIGQMSGAETTSRIVYAKQNGGNIFQDMSQFPNRPEMRAKHDAAMGRGSPPTDGATTQKKKRGSTIVGGGDLAGDTTILGA